MYVDIHRACSARARPASSQKSRLMSRWTSVFRSTLQAALLATAVSAGATGTAVDLASLEAWRSFRAAQPFQVQVIAVSAPESDKPRTLIFSEPAPTVRWEVLSSMLERYASACEVREWFLMSGGSVKDVICTLKKSLPTDWSEALTRLQLEAYGTTQGTPVVSLPVPKRKQIAHAIDVRFGASDLHRWLTEKNASTIYRTSPISPGLSFSSMLDSGTHGVFTSSDRSMVLWAIPRGGSIDKDRGDISQFAAASDLVLGAVANQRTVIVVGRSRRESLAHLPPLRSETILLLAGSTERQLAQSYERNDLLAGKGSDGVDRAPILLSPQLVDTEFGTLLNVADQLLKGWSMAGQVGYVDFSYPAPQSYPFGSTPAPFVNEGRQHFLFNWNTDGIAYRQTIDGVDVMVPQRTGALSVIYGDPKDRPRDMESTAYEYFAKSGDTTLARVVQYTLLYQVFRQFDVRAAKPAVSPRYAEFQEGLKGATLAQCKAIMGGLSNSDLENAITAYWTGIFERTKDPVSKARLIREYSAESMEVAKILRRAEEKSNGRASAALAEVIQAMRRKNLDTSASNTAALDAAATTLQKAFSADELTMLLRDGKLNRSRLLRIGAEKTGVWQTLKTVAAPGNSWNRTAYVVESKASGRAQGGVGGHNLDAPVLRFSESSTLPEGSISVTRGADNAWVVTHNPGDGNKVREIARQVGTRKELGKEEIESEVAQALKTTKADPPVSLNKVLASAEKMPEFKLVPARESAYRVRSLTSEEAKTLADLASGSQDAIIFEQLSDGAFVLSRTGSNEALQVSSITAATDALANGLIVGAGGKPPVAVLMRGIPDDKAEAILGFVQANVRRYPRDTVDHVLSSGRMDSLLAERPLLLNQKIAHNGIRIDHNGVKAERVVGGRYDGYTRMEVPITLEAKAPLHMRIIFFFKDFSTAVKERALNRVADLVAAIKGPTSAADVHAIVSRQLAKDMQDLQIESLLLRVDSDTSTKLHDTVIGNLDDEKETRVA